MWWIVVDDRNVHKCKMERAKCTKNELCMYVRNGTGCRNKMTKNSYDLNKSTINKDECWKVIHTKENDNW